MNRSPAIVSFATLLRAAGPFGDMVRGETARGDHRLKGTS